MKLHCKSRIFSVICLLSCIFGLNAQPLTEDVTEVSTKSPVNNSTDMSEFTEAEKKAMEDIVVLFHKFKKASTKHDGESFVNLVTKNSIERFAHIKYLTLNATEEELNNSNYCDQVYVLMLRLEMEVADIQNKSPKELMSFAVTKKSLGTTIHDVSKMQNLVVTKDTATAVHRKLEMMSKPGWFFKKESGQWRVDITQLLDQIGNDIEKLAGKGLKYPPSKELSLETVHTIVETFTFKELTRQHFKPLQKRDSIDG